MTKLTMCAVGDVRVDHVKVGRSTPEEVFELCVDVFRAADVNFFNCEGIYTDRTFAVPAQHTPGRSPPENFSAMAWAGFHVAGLANNHCLDMGAEGLMDTIELCRSNDMAVCGVGRDLAEARTPAVVERGGTKFAFLAYNCVGPLEYAARSDRAGNTPLRVTTHHEPIEYQPGTPSKILTFADRADLSAMVDDITKAKEQADVVALTFHWGLHHVEAKVAMYQQEIAYAAIDAGADVILGGADHVVKGIELYRGKVIYYGMGDFVLDTPLTEKTETAWRKMKHRIYGLHYDPDYTAYPFPPESRIHFIVKCDFTDGELTRAGLVPCMVNKMGQPEALKAEDDRFEDVRHYLQAISDDQGFNVDLVVDGDDVVVTAADRETTPIGPMFQLFLPSENVYSR